MIPQRETIGPPECPLMYRWTLCAPRIMGSVPFKVLLHRFIPDRMDKDVPHDHPRSFVTVVLRGGYRDYVPCPNDCVDGRIRMGAMHESGWMGAVVELNCPVCGGRGVVVGEVLRAPAIRFRQAQHAHMTHAGSHGAWTLVIMGPARRSWGFWRDGRWWHWREFEKRFGFAWRCD